MTSNYNSFIFFTFYIYTRLIYRWLFFFCVILYSPPPFHKNNNNKNTGNSLYIRQLFKRHMGTSMNKSGIIIKKEFTCDRNDSKLSHHVCYQTKIIKIQTTEYSNYRPILILKRAQNRGLWTDSNSVWSF